MRPQQAAIEIAGHTVLLGRCPHCDTTMHHTSHARLVELFHDHLRAEHPMAWVRV